MSDWPSHSDDPDAELKEADKLLQKADALLRKHKVPEPLRSDAGADDDIPILTDVVIDFEEGSSSRQDQSPVTADRLEFAELLVGLDTELAREIEAWFANELPQLVARELDRLADRLREEALAHMRATLAPALSQHISQRLGRGRDDKP